MKCCDHGSAVSFASGFFDQVDSKGRAVPAVWRLTEGQLGTAQYSLPLDQEDQVSPAIVEALDELSFLLDRRQLRSAKKTWMVIVIEGL